MITELNYQRFQSLLSSSKAFRYFWQFWSNYSFVFLIVAAAIIYFNPAFESDKKPIVVLVAISFVIARFVVVSLIALVYERKRPYQTYNFSPLTSKFFSFQTKRFNSFPSGHAAAFFSIATTVYFFAPVLGIILIAMAILTSIARVVLGYHWLSDIFMGMLIGIASACLTVYLAYPAIFT
jgi:undecaprenyl-diphosphatase